jgi:hypothetical protein
MWSRREIVQIALKDRSSLVESAPGGLNHCRRRHDVTDSPVMGK